MDLRPIPLSEQDSTRSSWMERSSHPTTFRGEGLWIQGDYRPDCIAVDGNRVADFEARRTRVAKELMDPEVGKNFGFGFVYREQVVGGSAILPGAGANWIFCRSLPPALPSQTAIMVVGGCLCSVVSEDADRF